MGAGIDFAQSEMLRLILKGVADASFTALDRQG
jgi:hypothetical protein